MTSTDQVPGGVVREVSAPRPVLIVFCHLRWNFVFQRPQHLLTRLAKRFDVLFVEEPLHAEGPPAFSTTRPSAGVEVLTPRTPESAPGFSDQQLPFIAALLQAFIAARGIVAPIAWFYTPMALPLVDVLEPGAIVYDCMDDLASFRFAPAQLVQREQALLQLADVVLTGGPSLHESRKRSRADARCLPSAVDVEHFCPANLQADSQEARIARDLHSGLESPLIGFFGVIDERLDLELVAALADARQDWQLVMVGPIVKIDPRSVPNRPNIRWIGMQGYDVLPHLLAHWDAAILPFALNESTRFISPTKTLEYLAGGVPVVSTPIHDVAALYGGAVRIAAGAVDFCRAIDEALRETPAARRARERKVQAVVAKATWDVAAARVFEWLDPFLAAPSADSPHLPAAGRPLHAKVEANRAVVSVSSAPS